jgi:hypothetical protein
MVFWPLLALLTIEVSHCLSRAAWHKLQHGVSLLMIAFSKDKCSMTTDDMVFMLLCYARSIQHTHAYAIQLGGPYYFGDGILKPLSVRSQLRAQIVHSVCSSDRYLDACICWFATSEISFSALVAGQRTDCLIFQQNLCCPYTSGFLIQRFYMLPLMGFGREVYLVMCAVCLASSFGIKIFRRPAVTSLLLLTRLHLVQDSELHFSDLCPANRRRVSELDLSSSVVVAIGQLPWSLVLGDKHHFKGREVSCPASMTHVHMDLVQGCWGPEGSVRCMVLISSTFVLNRLSKK